MSCGKETKAQCRCLRNSMFLSAPPPDFHTLVSMGFFKLLDKLLIPNIFGKELLLSESFESVYSFLSSSLGHDFSFWKDAPASLSLLLHIRTSLSLSQQLIELRHFLCSPEPLNQFHLPTKVSLLSLLFSVSFQPAASFWYIFSLQIKGFHFTEVFGLGYFCRICKCTCVHWQYNSVPSYAQFPEESQNYLPLSGFLHQMFPKDVILGLGWRFSPIVFPVLKLHTPYYSILFLPQKGISAYCLVYHAAFSWLFCKKCES